MPKSLANLSCLATLDLQYYEEIRGLYSSHKTGLTREDCPFFINMPKVLSAGNVGLFLNTLPHVQASIFPGPCHGVSSVGYIRLVVGSDTMKKFVGLTHLIKPVLQERVVHSL
jgi:hypothetical protein